ncbi:hypothetical protein Cch01nite_13730 [Cellulomonas chitinilytica]|uniref:OmpA-like domain-containing protein n=1 Tax=Cellulomonas chitinilytica TaxID=398759 RepID=A0A919U203_9CELL|nr:OmpA family protein [Cellulomonas chitinilytica]GIG20649.1 hypothetical protein Cch01nite_13730 [Cellulomonas chitinilytica]
MKTRTATTALAVLLLAILTACAGPTTAAPAGRTTTLAADALSACADVFSRTVPGASDRIVVVADHTASGAPSAMPDALRDAIAAASLVDGTITVVAVDGEGAAPAIVAKDAALSTEGARDRPSVAELAGHMPACVEQVLLPQATPHAPGTDLHRALSLASELVTPGTAVYLLSDMVSTTGPFALNEQLLSLPADDAAARVAAAAPLDLRGAALSVDGIGNTSTALLTADRDWLRDLTAALCTRWDATGCDDIRTNPVNATSRGGLPDDPMPAFPAVEVTSSAGTCTFEVPASLAFAGDSAQLAADAHEVFAPAIDLLRHNEAATATIVGHTASSGAHTAAELVDLSQRRADAVADVFVTGGVSEDRLTVTGVGDTQPRVEDIDPATGQQIEPLAATERRVDVVVEGAPCPA